jgi:hypothetical protein
MVRLIASTRRRGLGLAVSLWLALAAIAPSGALAPVAAASGWADFGTPTASSTFSSGVTFNQPVSVTRAVDRVELLLTAANSIGPTVIEVAGPLDPGATTLTHLLDPSVDGHLLPNTPLTGRWRLVGADDPTDVEIGPPVRVTYGDDRFDWRTEAGDLVRVHWYEGSSAFGSRALQIGEDAVKQAADLLKVTESDPIDFFVYADQAAFYDALGPGTRENVGGQANAEIRTMFALIPTGEIDQPWVGIVIPHELTHLVFDTAASNPYHFPPRWLNEGLAVYLSQGYDNADRGAVEGAAGSGRLIPLDGLIGQFPTSAERFSLAYAESVSAVDYLIRTYGHDALVSMIRSYAEGHTDDEAFSAAIGIDMTALGEAWLADLGAAAPVRYGPQTAPPGPTPAAWSGTDTSPGTSPGTSGAGGAVGTPTSPGEAGGSGDTTVPFLVVLLVVVAGGLIVSLGVRRRRRADRGPG